MSNIKRVFIYFSVFFISLLSGCVSRDFAAHGSDGSDMPYIVTDARGKRVVIKEKPQRIVSLTYGTDEILAELVPLRRIAAFSRWAGDPEITFITKEMAGMVGCKITGGSEQIMRLTPDLVVASVATEPGVVESLEDLGIPVFIACSPKNYAQVKEKVLSLAEVVGEEAAGRRTVQKMDERMERIENVLSRINKGEQRSVAAFSFSGPIGRRGRLFDDMLTRAHVVNAVTQEGIFAQGNVISKEQVVKSDPDMFLLPTWNYDNKNNATRFAQTVLNDPAFADLKAVKNGRIKFVSDRYRYVASHHYVDAVENIARAVYPEFFRAQRL